ncbi:MAG: bacillithiol biosynthesis deacetylase BshB1 [Psychrosphaera sp.]|nr:bacillithiol biosynthesis deacetylase BshB1 [Psychrosphaera sp.]
MIDILAICAHPDDAELHCGGLLLCAREHGALTGVLDLTRGEAASRGTPEIREKESAAASKLLGLTLRDNLGLPDGQLSVDGQYIQMIVEKIRQYQPRMVVTSHWDDHHPDHQATSMLVRQACYLAGIGNFAAQGTPHRPEQVLFYLDRLPHPPQMVQDISAVIEQKLAAVKCYASQLYSEDDQQMATPLASNDFLEQWQSRHRHFGSLIGVKHGEAYVLRSPVALNNPMNLLWGRIGLV